MDRLLGLAARQHGLVSLEQVRGVGVSRAQLRRLVASGALTLLAPRVYGTPDDAPGYPRRLRLGLLTLGPAAVVSHLAAAHLHGLVDSEPPPTFTVPRARRNARCPFDVHATDSLDDADRVAVGGFACTSVARLLADMAASDVPTQALADIAAAALAGRHCDRPSLDALLDRRRAAAGTRRLHRLLAAADDVDGVDELVGRRFLVALQRAGLPCPSTQDGAGTFRFEDWDLTVRITTSARDWPAIARAVRTELVAAGWSADRTRRVA